MPTDTNPNFKLSGHIANAQGNPLQGVIVRAYIQDAQGAGNPLGEEAVTEKNGGYSISCSLPADRPQKLYAEVYSQDRVLLATSDVLIFRSRKDHAAIDVQVDREIPPSNEEGRRVYGTVKDVDGRVLPGLVVQAFDRDLRSEQALGTTSTNTQGFYEIQYFARQFRNLEKGSADLVIEAFSIEGLPLGVSPILFNAPPDAEINLIIPASVIAPLSLFEKISQSFIPMLGNLKIAELEEDTQHQDLSFLSGETGFEKGLLARFVITHKLAGQALEAEFWFAILGGSFYEYKDISTLEEQLTGVLDALPSLDATAVRKALTRSFNQNEIALTLQPNTEKWIRAFLVFVASLLVKTEKSTFVKSALDHAGVRDPKKQEKFASLFNTYKALTPEFIKKLEKDSSFTKAEIADLSTSFHLADLTRGDFTVVRALKEEFGVRQPEKIRLLAKKNEAEWVKFVVDRSASGQIQLPIHLDAVGDGVKMSEAEVYGKMLERQFRQAFPTTAYVGGLERALQNGGAHGLQHAAEISRFLNQHEDLELLNTSLDDFLNQSVRKGFRRMAQNESFRLELKAVQRVFKLAITFEATDALLADHVHSAQQVYRLGQSQFVQRYGSRPGFTPESARLAWNRAAETHALVLTVVGDLKSLENNALPAVLQKDDTALQTFPNWDNLFKTGDFCECEHCRSVLGPAAYFADILMFLKNRRAKTAPKTVKDLIFNRRPDLGLLELNCENALTTLPYIDVVCEALEDRVDEADENHLELTGFTAMPTDPIAAQAAVAKAFQDALTDPINTDKEKISLGNNLSISQIDPSDPNRWMVHSDNVTYFLTKDGSPNFFAEIARNTKASDAELRAYPQYVNPIAYAKLREAIFPLTLPFDLFDAEVRATFEKSNLQRWDLMQTFRGSAAPNNPTEIEIAAEYFGISVNSSAASDEKHLILVADPTEAGQQAVWGQTGVDWLEKVANVKIFLQKTSLEYNDLLILLDLKIINPGGSLSIYYSDPSCDTDKQSIQNLDIATLDRIHRFLRLWRKLIGWKMWELDLVIRNLNIGAGNLDEPFLINLFYFERLRKRLGTKANIERISALFDNLNIETHFTLLHEKREDALYQNLFMDRRLINPLDAAFQLDPSTGDLLAGQTISAHQSVVLAALGISETDLILFKTLVKSSDGLPYITDDLNLANLSFLWRHFWLSNLLKFNADGWKMLLKLSQLDIEQFEDPRSAWEFVERIDQLKLTGFMVDELNWILSADRTAKAATKEADTVRFLTSLRKDLQSIKAAYDPAQFDFLTVTPPTDIDKLTALLVKLLQQLNRDTIGTQFFIATLRDEVTLVTNVTGLPAGFQFPAALTNPVPPAKPIRISYDESTTLHFTGVMTTDQQSTLLNDPSLSAVTGIPTYQEAINELFDSPRLALKIFEPIFTVPLANLPTGVDFKNLTDQTLAQKISYDSEQRALHFVGILSKDGKAALKDLSTDADYLTAIDNLFGQAKLITPPDDRIWLMDTDLQFPLRDNLAQNLATAVMKVLPYLSKTLSENAVVRQSASQLGLTEALTRSLFSDYALLPDTLLVHLVGIFSATTGVVDYATLKTTFDAWYWTNRVAMILKKWKLTSVELEKIRDLTNPAQLLDFLSLPLDQTGAIASLDRFLRIGRLLRLRDSLKEIDITLLEVLEKLNSIVYATISEFAADVERLNDAWHAVDIEALVTSLDLSYPTDYLLAENWERVRRAFYFIENLNAGADTVSAFAAATMSDVNAKTLKELLRSKLGVETWLALSTEIQDVLRERKRDALAAYLLAQPQPIDAPSGKWENTNDLYAYYLLDVEMSSCQLTSRLVQASGSVQLFVQRCFMGLEPQVVVQIDGTDGDKAWLWWKWMSKYRVWEANRKVFLWPENWIEPELKKDRSQFFKSLENELQQNEINQYTVETAFQNYLEKLDGVSQLEIAGFYQEDDGDDTIIHVFGRTPGAEPHIYYYRRYDYHQWTPWEKVDLDIQGDYLIPAVVNRRLFLFWPIFSEVPDEKENNTITTPHFDQNISMQKTAKKLRIQMAVSDYRQGKWTPKKISKDYSESTSFILDVVRKFYQFIPIDRSDIDGRFIIRFIGWSLANHSLYHSVQVGLLDGAFELVGCKGVPQLTTAAGTYIPLIHPEWVSVAPVDNGRLFTSFMKWIELGNPDEVMNPTSRRDLPQNDFTLENVFASTSDVFRFTPLLTETPDIFKMSPPWQLSYLDKLLVDGILILLTNPGSRLNLPQLSLPLGSWLPFFYNDKSRTFFVLPALLIVRGGRTDGLTHFPGIRQLYYYPEIKKIFRQMENHFEEQVQAWLDSLDISTIPPDQRQVMEGLLSRAFPEEPLPPYTDEQLKSLIKRLLMRYFHLYLGELALRLYPHEQFHYKNFYHPFVCDFRKLVYNPLKGIPALMRRDTQLWNSGFSFNQTYQPTAWVVEPTSENYYPKEIVDFTRDGAYSSYNWELFFLAPLLIANALSKNLRFEEARDWYHFIFNPLGLESTTPGGSPMSKYWITKPFFETTDTQYIQQRIENILRMLAGDTSVPGFSNEAKRELEDQVRDWRTYPFEPHRIASYRTVAYQKTVVMKYLDNLIAWGDYLFRQDSMESINQATQIYIAAAEILGPRPMKIPPHVIPPVQTFNELETAFDTFSNALVQVENLLPMMPGSENYGEEAAPLPTLYFCIPQNDKMLSYWDTVADRLFKIRHCMNIEGVVRQLALFELPIDPGALVKAVAAGIDISSALSDFNVPLPFYRFNILLQKANEVCNDVKVLGSALLAALEKKDAETLGLLRQGQEINLLEAMKIVRENQINEAQDNLNALNKSKELAEKKKTYYESRDFMSTGELTAMALQITSIASHTAGTIADILAGVMFLIPDFHIGASGFGGSPHFTAEPPTGEKIGESTARGANGLYNIAAITEKSAGLTSTIAGYQRRQDEWDFQKDLAIKEMEQIDNSIAAATLRVAIAVAERDNHNMQTDNARAIDDFMRSKYTNEELFQWQVGQISQAYFQSYQLVYDLAKQAERCFRFELGLQDDDQSYINFGYWDSLKKGLLAGEKLQYDLRRLEAAYMAQNRREFELTKTVSLLLLDPFALIKLRETGQCFFNLPEEIFDLDYPGHYFRRIKSMSLTLPCVVGPYTTISCTLRQTKNSVRINTLDANTAEDYPRHINDQGFPVEDDRFIENNIAVKAIATSSGQNDSGVFELSFRDERYLPFEGGGVISEWSLELFSDLPSNNPDPAHPDFGRPLRQFDYETISDVILHIKYTAREASETFKDSAVGHLREYFSQDQPSPSLRMFNLRQEFPTQWYRFLNPANPADGNVFEFDMSTDLFNYRDHDKTLKINRITLLARCINSDPYTVVLDPPLSAGSDTFTLAQEPQLGGLHFAQTPDGANLGIEIASTGLPAKWRLKMTGPNGNLQAYPKEVEDLLMILVYDWKDM